MIGLGTLINTGAIVAGGLLGSLIGKAIKETTQDSLTKACGVATMFISIGGALEGMLQVEGPAVSSGKGLFIVLCLALGTLIGELIDLGVRYEYNFWPYGTGREYRGAKPLTPYITLGVGGTYASARRKIFTANIPVGFGVKYKVAPRWNLGLEWLIHFSLSDELDGVKDPYGIVSTGAFKNTDCYTSLQVSLTYDLWAKCKVCHNDKE